MDIFTPYLNEAERSFRLIIFFTQPDYASGTVTVDLTQQQYL
jgi:hypothetical protein